MSDEPPFAVGQRVRMTAKGRATFPLDKGYVGTVKRVFSDGLDIYLGVRRDGYARARSERFHSSFWEPLPLNELTLDQTAQLLADAVKRGDTSAALPLADRVMELHGATPNRERGQT